MHLVLLRSHNALVQAPSAMSSRTVLTRLYLNYGLRALRRNSVLPQFSGVPKWSIQIPLSLGRVNHA
jgi:hypothetical protein